MKLKLTNATVAIVRPAVRPFEVYDTDLKGLLLRVQPSGVMTYYVAYRGPEGRVREKIGRHGVLTPAQARDQARQVLADVTKGVNRRAAKKAAKAHDLKTFIEEVYRPWAESHRKRGRMEAERILSRFADFHGKKLDEINPWVVEKWRSSRAKSGIEPVTINRDVAALRSALSKAVEWGILQAHPLARLKPLKVDRSPTARYLTDDEEKRLREALDTREEKARAERDTANAWRRERGYRELPDLRALPYVDHLKPMVLLSLNTGLRRGEVFNLRWADLDLSRAMLTVAGTTAKSGHSRHVPLNREALDVLRGWKRQAPDLGGLVFPGRGGHPRDNVRKSWEAVLREAGISAFRWHDLRHHFASRLVQAGVDLNTVRELLGHADLKMTLRYAHLAPHVKAEAVERLVGT